MRYRILRPSDLIRYGDERWDFELGWTKMEDPHMERFSKEYRRAGENAWRFRRPLTATISNQHHERTKIIARYVDADMAKAIITEHECYRPMLDALKEVETMLNAELARDYESTSWAKKVRAALMTIDQKRGAR